MGGAVHPAQGGMQRARGAMEGRRRGILRLLDPPPPCIRIAAAAGVSPMWSCWGGGQGGCDGHLVGVPTSPCTACLPLSLPIPNSSCSHVGRLAIDALPESVVIGLLCLSPEVPSPPNSPLPRDAAHSNPGLASKPPHQRRPFPSSSTSRPPGSIHGLHCRGFPGQPSRGPPPLPPPPKPAPTPPPHVAFGRPSQHRWLCGALGSPSPASTSCGSPSR